MSQAKQAEYAMELKLAAVRRVRAGSGLRAGEGCSYRQLRGQHFVHRRPRSRIRQGYLPHQRHRLSLAKLVEVVS